MGTEPLLCRQLALVEVTHHAGDHQQPFELSLGLDHHAGATHFQHGLCPRQSRGQQGSTRSLRNGRQRNRANTRRRRSTQLLQARGHQPCCQRHDFLLFSKLQGSKDLIHLFEEDRHNDTLHLIHYLLVALRNHHISGKRFSQGFGLESSTGRQHHPRKLGWCTGSRRQQATDQRGTNRSHAHDSNGTWETFLLHRELVVFLHVPSTAT
mmetsp:Transcript_16200/g.35636  ORF Transcript_16200/g.35636 Transcript_16200/m.35636 type:complete len:209 (+) Transcript_16200:270-896(+)